MSGSLRHVSVPDVLQFIHFSRRTGTLLLRHERGHAWLGFRNGQLVAARAPETPRLGELLVASGVLDSNTLEEAVVDQRLIEPRPALGQLLMRLGLADAVELRQAIEEQIELAVGRVIEWRSGVFEFDPEPEHVVDGANHPPFGGVEPEAGLNTERVLLDALRILDERDRDAAAGAVSRLPPPAPAEATLDAGARTIHLVSSDHSLADSLRSLAPDVTVDVCALELAGVAEGRPFVVVDLRGGGPPAVQRLAAFHVRRPRTPLIALVDGEVSLDDAYAAGAAATVPARAAPVLACIENLTRGFGSLVDGATDGRDGVARLRRVFGDLRSGLMSATVVLNLMNVLSESVERAILLLVRGDHLQVLGAFGNSADGRPLAEVTRGLRIPSDGANALARVVEGGNTLSLPFEEAHLPGPLESALGRPASGEVVVMPVEGTRDVISVIYCDNGGRTAPIQDVGILELAAAQVGMAFESEMLRRGGPAAQ